MPSEVDEKYFIDKTHIDKLVIFVNPEASVQFLFSFGEISYIEVHIEKYLNKKYFLTTIAMTDFFTF